MNEWTEVTLGEVAEVNPETTPRNWADDHLIRYVDIASVTAGRGIDVGAIEAQPFGSAPGRARRRIRSGDVLVSTVRPNLRAFARVPDCLDGEVASTGFAVLRAKAGFVDPGYLWCVVESEAFVADMVARCTGSNYPAIRASDVAAYSVALPPLSEQRRIADLVHFADSHLQALGEELAANEVLLGALRSSLSEVGMRTPLSQYASTDGIQIGPFGSQLHSHEYTDDVDGVPVVMPRDLVNGAISSAKIQRVPEEVAVRLKKHRLKAGDIVFPRRGDLTKRALVTSEQEGWLCGTGCLRFRPRATDDAALLAEALAGAEVSDWLIENAVGTTMLNLNTTILSKVPVPDISESRAVAAASVAALANARSLRTELARARTARATLLTSLLDGDLGLSESYDRLIAEVA